MEKFKLIGHTADLIIEGRGATLKKAFENTALGLFSVTADLKKLKPIKNVTIREKASSLEELVSYVLNDLVAESDARELFFKSFKIEKLDLKNFSMVGKAAASKMTPEAGEYRISFRGTSLSSNSISSEATATLFVGSSLLTDLKAAVRGVLLFPGAEQIFYSLLALIGSFI